MKVALFLTFVCLAAASPKVRQVNNLDYPARIPGEFLIVLHRPTGKESNFRYATQVSNKIAAISSKITVLKLFTNLMAPILYVKTTDEVVMSQLFAIDEIDSIDVNAKEKMIEQCFGQATGTNLWGLSRLSSRTPPNWSSATYNSRRDEGAGVRVYIHDTSIRTTHVDFGGRAIFGANFIGGGNGDLNGHGTHCAGTVAGTQYGVSKSATVVAVKVLGDSGAGTWDAIVAGLDWMVGDVQSRGVRGVASMSLGGGANTATDSAVNSADAANIPVITSAGNNNFDACNNSPSRASGAITVGSTDITDTLASSSNWGSCVNLLAPGVNILSASHTSDTGSTTLSGTSMACPHVAGLVATYLSRQPTATSSQVKIFLSSSASQNYINLRGVSDTPNLLLYNNCA